MFVVAVNHLRDVVVVVVGVAFVSGVLPLADAVADGGNGAGDWHDSLSLDSDSCHQLRHFGDDAVARQNLPAPVSESDSREVVMVLGCGADTGSGHPAQDALRPGSCSATGNYGWDWREARIAEVRG